MDFKIIDAYNRKILMELQENARISYTELGKKVGLTGPAVKERVHKLEEQGVIKGYRAKIDLEKIGYSLMAIIHFKMSPGSIYKFIEQLRTMPEIIEVNRITGGDNMVIKVALSESSHLERLINRFIEYGVPNTSIVLSTPIEDRILEPKG